MDRVEPPSDEGTEQGEDARFRPPPPDTRDGREDVPIETIWQRPSLGNIVLVVAILLFLALSVALDPSAPPPYRAR